MDFTPFIIVAVFAGWAFYLIPKFMRDHEDLATTRSLQDFSARVRVFAAVRTGSKTKLLGPDEPTVEISMQEVAEALGEKSAARVTERRSGVSRPLPTLAAAKRAARRRRRVLLGLLLLTTIVSVLAFVSVGPAWTPSIPAALVGLFMISSRRSVRRLNAARKASRKESRGMASSARESHEVGLGSSLAEEAIRHDGPLEQPEAHEVVVESPADRLWDPVPMTLPTYLDKPAARRTVMSIELNEGMVSSGHDAEDSELVRAAEAAALADDTPVDLEAPRAAGA